MVEVVKFYAATSLIPGTLAVILRGYRLISFIVLV